MISVRLLPAFAGLLILCACAAAPSGPVNVGQAKTEALRYHDSGQYMTDLASAEAPAVPFMLDAARHVAKPAIVLDIDETSLSNWPEIKADDMAFLTDGPCGKLPKGPCGIHAWQDQASAAAIAPTLHLYHVARDHGIAVFFLTGRDDTVRDATAKNLRRAGYDQGWNELIMRNAHTKTPSATDYKAPQRARIESMGYTVLLSVGDQYSDLEGGHALKTIKLPNPYYYIP